MLLPHATYRRQTKRFPHRTLPVSLSLSRRDNAKPRQGTRAPTTRRWTAPPGAGTPSPAARRRWTARGAGTPSNGTKSRFVRFPCSHAPSCRSSPSLSLSPPSRARLASPHLTCACARGMWGWGSEFDAVRVAWPRLSARTLPPAAVPFPDKRGRARARILGARLGCGLRFDAVLRFFALKDPRSRWLSQGMEEFLLEHEEVLAQVRLPSIALNSLRFDVWLP